MRIGQHRRAARHLRLAPVHRRHLPPAGGKAAFDAFDNRRIFVERQIEMRGHHLARQIIVGGAKPAGEDHDAMPRQGVRHVRAQFVAVVADDRLERHRDAQLVEDLRDVQRIGVGLLWCQQLTANRDDRGIQAGVVSHIVNHAGHIAIAMRITIWP